MTFGQKIRYIIDGNPPPPNDAPSQQPASVYQAQLHPVIGIIAEPYVDPLLPYQVGYVIPLTYDLTHPTRYQGIHADRVNFPDAPNVMQIDTSPLPTPLSAGPSVTGVLTGNTINTPDPAPTVWQSFRQNLATATANLLQTLPGDEI